MATTEHPDPAMGRRGMINIRIRPEVRELIDQVE